MKKVIKLALVISFISLMSCSNSDDSAATGSCSSDIPFVQPGKTFTVKVTQFGFDAGTIKFDIGNCNGSGFLVTRQAYDATGTATTSGTDLWKQEGAFLLTDSNNNGDYFSKIYKKGAALGDTWQITRPTDGAVITHEVIDIDSLITVPAGTFHCKVFKYVNSETINDSYIFWNDEIGQVKEDAGFFTTELQSYN
ncbi:hypothetical protein [Flavobacterium sp.]|uniref:hypothetical protein n=1 Tax=Flavobacterium sp. TaxID=239 RepID=UPI00262DA74D|nr:hypothetical protein [Flavobacterium sp.]